MTALENKLPFILCVISGIIFIQAAWVGSIGFLQYIVVIGTIPELLEFVWLINLLLWVLVAIASLGGIGVIAGGFLLTKGRVGTGKFVIGLAVGMSFIGVIIKTITTIWLTGGTGIMDAFLLEATITEWVAVFMSIFARRMAA